LPASVSLPSKFATEIAPSISATSGEFAGVAVLHES